MTTQISEYSQFLFLSFNFLSGESVTIHCDLSRGNTSRLNVAWYKKAGNSQEKLISGNNDSLSLTVHGHAPVGAQNHVIHYRCIVRNADGVGLSPSAKLVILSKGILGVFFIVV